MAQTLQLELSQASPVARTLESLTTQLLESEHSRHESRVVEQAAHSPSPDDVRWKNDFAVTVLLIQSRHPLLSMQFAQLAPHAISVTGFPKTYNSSSCCCTQGNSCPYLK